MTKSLRWLIALSLVMSLAANSFGAKVSVDDARQIAAEFLSTGGATPLSVAENPVVTAGTAKAPLYYVFNSTDGKAFVIVSAEDTTVPVLGFSFEGGYPVQQTPDAMSWMLEGVQRELKAAPSLQSSIAPAERRRMARVADSGEKLLTTAAWSQEGPFNQMIPGKPLVGCVGTAMATIMKFYSWPPAGSGSFGGVDFNTQYAWNDMRMDNYRSGYSAAEADAVATLMWHASKAIDTQYAMSGSSAYEVRVPGALSTFFGYDPGVSYRKRSEVATQQEWDALVKAEIDAGRPVLYCGQDVSAGHAFVCDGYKGEYLHFNWGWGGSANGYFLSTALNPTVSRTHYYNNLNTIIYNIKPASGAISNWSDIHITADGNQIGIGSDLADLSAGKSFKVRVGNLKNLSYDDFSGKIAVALCGANGGVKYLLSNESNFNLPSMQLLYAGYVTFNGCKLPDNASVADDDVIRIVTQKSGSSEWLPVAGELLTTNELAPSRRPAKFNVNFDVADGVIVDCEPDVVCGFDYKFKAALVDEVNDVLTVKANGYVLTPDANNYYNISNVCADQQISLIVQKAADVKEKRNFWVETPGTLSSLIAENETGVIKDLTLFGSIDANDFIFMREKMRLSRLDLSGVYVAANGTNQANAIPREAFRGCSALKEVILPNSINRLNNGCFRQCGITSIVIPANVKTYEYNIFVAASALRDIWVGRESAEFINWCVLSGVKVDLATLHVPSEKAWTNYSKAENWNTIKNIVVEKAPASTDAVFAVQENNDVKFDSSIETGKVAPGQEVTFTADYIADSDNRMLVYANSMLLSPNAEGKYSTKVNGNTIIHFELVEPTATAGKSQWTLTDANGSIGLLTDAVNVIPGQEFSVRVNALNIPNYFEQLYWAMALVDANDNIKEFISPINVWSAGAANNHKFNVNCCVKESSVREGNKLRLVTSANRKVWNVVEGGNADIVAALPAINNMNPVYNITVPKVDGVAISGAVESAVRGRDITLKLVPTIPGYRLNVTENGKKIATNASSLTHTFIALEDKEFEIEVFDPKAGGVAEFTVAPGTFHIQLTEANVAETVIVRGQAYSLDIQAATGKDFAIKTIKTLDLSGVEIVKSGGYEDNVIYHPFFTYTNGMATPASVVTSIILPDGLKRIPGGIFTNTPNIEEITIPAGISSVPEIGTYPSGSKKYTYAIADEAFKGLTKLTKLRIPGQLNSYNGELLVAHHHPYASTGSQYYSYYNLGHPDPKKVTIIVPDEYLNIYRTAKNNMYLGNPWKAHGYNILSEEPVYGVTFDQTRIKPAEENLNLERLASFLGDNVATASIVVDGKLRLANPERACRVFDNGEEIKLAEDGSIPVTFYNPAKNADKSGSHHLDVVYLHDVEFTAASSLFSIKQPVVENEAGYHFESFAAGEDNSAVLSGVAENSVVKFGVEFATEHDKGLELRVMLGQQELTADEDGLYAVNVANAPQAVEIFAVPTDGATLNAEELSTIHEADAKSISSIALAGEISVEEFNQAMKMFNNVESLDLSGLQSELPVNAFAGMENLTQVVLPEVETISAGLFDGCSALQTIEIPASVNIVGEDAFKGCESLESVRFTGVTEIGAGAFDGCKSLTSVTILADNTTPAPDNAPRRAPRRVNVSSEAFRGINPNCVVVLDEGVMLPVAKANYLTTTSGIISETQPDGSIIEREGRTYSAGNDMSFVGGYPLAIPHHFVLDEDKKVTLDIELASIDGVCVPFDVKAITDADGNQLPISLPSKKVVDDEADAPALQAEDGPKAYIYGAEEKEATMVAQTSMKANTPYVASLPAAGKYTFVAADGTVPSTPAAVSAAGNGFEIHASYAETTLPATETYLLNDNGQAFEKAGTDAEEEVAVHPFGVYALSRAAQESISTGIFDSNVETITEEVLAVDELRIFRSGDKLVILSPEACVKNVYATDGRLLRTLKLSEGRNEMELPAKGIYIIGSHRILF